MEPATNQSFHNRACVVAPDGRVVFRQDKAVPIQFFRDGLPAETQQVWESPWGRVGVCICYDLSYARVTDRLVRQGVQALIVPAMDAIHWGRREHELHARVAPVRAAEYGVPIFRVVSSGISQLVDSRGRVQATAPFPGENEMIAGELRLGPFARRPLDRWLAPACTVFTFLTGLWLLVQAVDDRIQTRLLTRRWRVDPITPRVA
jgi:apolipoprotein N-acyltransferase